MRQCLSCGQPKTDAEMRYRSQPRGRVPVICQECRDGHAGWAWCTPHADWHPEGSFTKMPGARGFHTFCKSAVADQNASRSLDEMRSCIACENDKPRSRFRGNTHKISVCMDCESAHPGMYWCAWCSRWRFEEEFQLRNGHPRLNYCRPCRPLASRGVTEAHILQVQGSIRRECASCKADDVPLSVDHDHRCCPDKQGGCLKCVRGFLCRPCNVAEGLMVTAERAMALALYMERHESLRAM